MYTRDYIMRMIEQLMKVIELVMFQKRQHEYPKALDELHLGGSKLLGVDWSFFVKLSDGAMIESLRRRAEIDHRVYEIAGDLLKEESDILHLQEHDEDAWTRMVCAFSLYCEALQVEESAELREKALFALHQVDEYELPASVRKKRDWIRGNQ
jgi:hypothetical protein